MASVAYSPYRLHTVATGAGAYRIVTVAPSPDGRYVAELELSNFGATTPFATHVQVVDPLPFPRALFENLLSIRHLQGAVFSYEGCHSGCM